MSLNEELGKIESVTIGKRCDDSPFGIHFTFSGRGWGVQGSLHHFRLNGDLQGLKGLCEKAKVKNVNELKGIPVRVYFDENRVIQKAEILTEVL